MTFKEFLKDKIISICMLFFAILTIEIFLLMYNETFLKIYVPIIIISTYILSLYIEFIQKKKWYNDTENVIANIENKALVCEMLDTPQFIEGKKSKEYIENICNYSLNEMKKIKKSKKEYKEYIEMWIHEIKLPIATAKLIIENNKNEITKNIEEEIDKIEDYTQQALFYARSDLVEKDYLIKKCKLEDIINNCIQKNKTNIINNKISIEIKDINKMVYTDSKWIIFIINQILSNSIKYMDKDEKIIKISTTTNKENVILTIEDNGCGIQKNELNKVFNKGFTGENGRNEKNKSTGIGLYLVKKLCIKLRLGIEITSVYNENTKVNIIFPKGSFLTLQ